MFKCWEFWQTFYEILKFSIYVSKYQLCGGQSGPAAHGLRRVRRKFRVAARKLAPHAAAEERADLSPGPSR